MSLNLVMCSGFKAQHICIVDPADLDVSLYYCLVLGLDDLMTLMLGNCLFVFYALWFRTIAHIIIPD